MTALVRLRTDLVLTGFSKGWGELINYVFVSYWIKDAKKPFLAGSGWSWFSVWAWDTYNWMVEAVLVGRVVMGSWSLCFLGCCSSFHTCRIRKGSYSVNSNSCECRKNWTRAWALGPGCLALNPNFMYYLYINNICAALSFSVQRGIISTYLIGYLKHLVIHLKYFEQYVSQKHSSVSYTHSFLLLLLIR